jgi:hypothetical protein
VADEPDVTTTPTISSRSSVSRTTSPRLAEIPVDDSEFESGA